MVAKTWTSGIKSLESQAINDTTDIMASTDPPEETPWDEKTKAKFEKYVNTNAYSMREAGRLTGETVNGLENILIHARRRRQGA